ncbi:hypothetical protein HAX54_021662 [Datura stramonium]|uniref:Leucine-rich repeat-containing N-terminal plant-type domain-containing protein n=1 Tax=Datura stramonium TaxID=4076 RepID=A0ABS8RKA5_DATST|nr:hypothetical protein [Datura stramonium]
MGLLLYFQLSVIVLSIAISGLESTDQLALQDFKSRITEDPLHVMASWNHSFHYCNWTGVTCSPSYVRVTILDLSSRKLSWHHTAIHWQSQLPNGGKIPTNLSYCKEIRVLVLRANGLVGKIVDQLSSLSKLNFLRPKRNSLTGGIPNWIGNFSSLRYLDISSNSLQGPIPQDLGRLMSLESTASPDLSVSLANASRRRVIDFSQNKLIGDVPTSLGKLKSLIRLNFEVNRLGRGSHEGLKFLDFLTNCTNLIVLSFAANYFNGELPYSITNLSTVVEILSLGDNRIHGTLPAGVGSLINLTQLGMERNCLNGSTPEAIGKLNGLERPLFEWKCFFGEDTTLHW